MTKSGGRRLRKLGFFSLLLAALVLAGCRSSGSATEGQMMEEEQMEEEQMEGEMMEGEMMENATAFSVRIENVSTVNTLQTSKKSKPVPLSPGVFVVHTSSAPFFTAGQPASPGLELIAEDGFPMKLAQSVKKMKKRGEQGILGSGVFAVPAGKGEKGPLKPGDAYQFTVEAGPGQRLSFATMFVQSNDLFFAPSESGIALFEDGQPVSGDVTSQVMLWDAGTEQNEEPGVGPHTKPKQGKKARDVGPKESKPVRPVSQAGDGYSYPDVSEVIRVTIMPK